MSLPLTEEQWRAIDGFIFRGWTINAIKAVREATGVGIHDAVDLVEERRTVLLESRPTEFVAEQGFGGFETTHFNA